MHDLFQTHYLLLQTKAVDMSVSSPDSLILQCTVSTVILLICGVKLKIIFLYFNLLFSYMPYKPSMRNSPTAHTFVKTLNNKAGIHV